MKLKVGDEVLVTAGKDKGRKGKIEKVFPKTGKILVPGVNIYKKHQKRGLSGGEGGIIERSRPLSPASLAVICPSCSRPTRVVYQISKSGEKTRICAKCKKQIVFDEKKGQK